MTQDQVITVDAVAGGWQVRCGDMQPLMFLSGGRAEAQARALALCFAELGRDARVVVLDRASAMVGARRYFAP